MALAASAPAERPVLSRRLMKIETRIWTLSNTDSTDAHRFL